MAANSNRSIARRGRIYLVRYVQEYEREGLAIWGLTVQNEPLATQVWDSCIYTGEEERDFVRDFLGPASWKKKGC